MIHDFGKHVVREAWTDDQCRLCWLYAFDQRYRQRFESIARQAPPRTLECFHLGEVLDQRGCHCPGRWLRECDVHGHCTWGDASLGRCCSTCDDYTAEPPATGRRSVGNGTPSIDDS